MQRLMELRLREHAPLLPPGLDHAAARARLAALLAARTGPETAGLFAEAREEPQGTLVFSAPPGEVSPFADLDAEGQALLRAEIGRLISELRRATQDDPEAAALVRAATEIPRPDAVFAHEGRPILAGWGLAPRGQPGGLGLLAGLDDGRPETPRATTPWGVIGLAAGLLLGLGAVAAVALPTLAGWAIPGPAVCTIAPGQEDRLGALLREQQREAELRNRIAEAVRRLGDRRLACPLPPPPPPQPPPRQPDPPPTPPPPRTDLPEDRWRQRDLSILEGCWDLDSDYTTRDRQTGRLNRVRSWQMCFDRNGRGRQTLVFDNGIRCQAPAQGRFEGENFIVDDTQNVQCSDGSYIFHRRSTCRRVSDQRAQCESRHVDPSVTGRATFFMRR